MNSTVVALTVALIVAIALGAYAIAAALQRRAMLKRADSGAHGPRRAVLRDERREGSTFSDWIARFGSEQKENKTLANKLVQAGYDTPTAPALYFVLRTSALVIFPVVALLFTPRTDFTVYVLALVIAAFVGLILPAAWLDRSVRLRQERMRRSVPDALDLLVVCVEAGVSLDAAILRVAREITLAHPELARELSVVNRLTNAGMPRDAALRGLWQRTGVEDLRALVASLIQSEKWGTSVATVLRVSAETLRRKRRQYAEKKAKMAPLKMTFPLLFFILPALFVVILGPAIVQIINEFGKI